MGRNVGVWLKEPRLVAGAIWSLGKAAPGHMTSAAGVDGAGNGRFRLLEAEP